MPQAHSGKLADRYQRGVSLRHKRRGKSTRTCSGRPIATRLRSSRPATAPACPNSYRSAMSGCSQVPSRSYAALLR